MYELTIKQSWVLHRGFQDRPLIARVFVTCTDGSGLAEEFTGPDDAQASVDVADGSACYIKHTLPDSAFVTESNCPANVYVDQPTVCEFTSAGFNESVPIFHGPGLAILIAVVVAVGWFAISRKAIAG